MSTSIGPVTSSELVLTDQSGVVDRFVAQCDDTPETGSDAGSNLQLQRIADDETRQTVFTVTRDTGLTTFEDGVVFAGSITLDGGRIE